MQYLVTGCNGTIGSKLRSYLQDRGDKVFCWDRTRVKIDNYQAMEDYLVQINPDAVFHLAIASQPSGRENEQWLVNYQWPSEIAWICRKLGIPLVYTSTAMVFSDSQSGPFTLDSEPESLEGYGYLKRQSERRVFYQYPQARIARLGWQIGSAPGSNNMVDFLDKKMQEVGEVSCSELWLPACSFLEDTVAALVHLLDLDPGLYMLDSNKGWNFYQIASALNASLGSPWKILPARDFEFDQRMLDARCGIPPLSQRLPQLPALAQA